MNTGQIDNELTMEKALKEIIRTVEKIQGKYYDEPEDFIADAEHALEKIYDAATDTHLWLGDSSKAWEE